jgi:hypothetical protein
MDSLKSTKGIMIDPLKKNNKSIRLDSLNNPKGVISDSLKRFNNKLGTDSLKKDIKKLPEP